MKQKTLVLRWLAIVLVLCLFLVSCGEAEREEKDPKQSNEEEIIEPNVTEKNEPGAVERRTIKVAYQAIADSMEPSSLLGVAECVCYAQAYDSLLTKGEDNILLPGIAEEWGMSEDGLTYWFKLNPNAKFSDGVDITAEDVEFSINLFREAGAHAWVFEEVESVKVIDDYNVEVYLKSPKASLINSFANQMHFCVVAKHAYEEWGDEYGTSVDKVVCSGPYDLVDWEYDVSMTFKARPDYYRGEADIEEATIYQITDTNAAVVALETGELDIYFVPISGSSYDRLEKVDSIVLDEYLSARFECLHFYYKDGMFADLRMRQAVAHAIKPEEALLLGHEGMGELTRYPGDIGTSMQANPDRDPLKTYEYDLEKAKDLVEECGNVGAPVVIKSYNTDPYATLGTWLQSILTSIGLDATVEPMERGAFLSACNAEEVEILILSWNGQAYDMDESLGNLVYSGSVGTNGNYGFYTDDEMDELVLRGRASTDIDERTEIYGQIIDKISEDLPLLPLYVVKTIFGHSADLETINVRDYSLFSYSWK